MSPTPIHMTIIGAGPSGLVLANLLHKHHIPFSIYELRARPSPKLVSIPSGSLDLHRESGQLALQKCGLTSQFTALTSECSEEQIVCDRFGVVKYRDDGMGSDRPEISRNALTELLISSLPDDLIQWEHKLLSVEPCSEGPHKWRLKFEGKEVQTDMVIGADGAWSRVRPVLTDVKPHFSGVHIITLTIPHITSRFPELEEMIGKGTWHAGGGNTVIASQRGVNDSARIYGFFHTKDEEYFEKKGMHALRKEQMKEALLGENGEVVGWAEKIKDLLRRGLDEEKGIVEIEGLYMLPIGHTWESNARATLVGDAAHLMTPFAGEGVNQGMLDALQLAEGLIHAIGRGGEVAEAVKSYEAKMFERTKVEAEGTWENLHMFFGPRAPMPVVEFFMSMQQQPEPDRDGSR